MTEGKILREIWQELKQSAEKVYEIGVNMILKGLND